MSWSTCAYTCPAKTTPCHTPLSPLDISDNHNLYTTTFANSAQNNRGATPTPHPARSLSKQADKTRSTGSVKENLICYTPGPSAGYLSLHDPSRSLILPLRERLRGVGGVPS